MSLSLDTEVELAWGFVFKHLELKWMENTKNFFESLEGCVRPNSTVEKITEYSMEIDDRISLLKDSLIENEEVTVDQTFPQATILTKELASEFASCVSDCFECDDEELFRIILELDISSLKKSCLSAGDVEV